MDKFSSSASTSTSLPLLLPLPLFIILANLRDVMSNLVTGVNMDLVVNDPVGLISCDFSIGGVTSAPTKQARSERPNPLFRGFKFLLIQTID